MAEVSVEVGGIRELHVSLATFSLSECSSDRLYFFSSGILRSRSGATSCMQPLSPMFAYLGAKTFYSEGQARITVFAASANARTFNYQAGDIGKSYL
jgi:hypothetical protein